MFAAAAPVRVPLAVSAAAGVSFHLGFCVAMAVAFVEIMQML